MISLSYDCPCLHVAHMTHPWPSRACLSYQFIISLRLNTLSPFPSYLSGDWLVLHECQENAKVLAGSWQFEWSTAQLAEYCMETGEMCRNKYWILFVFSQRADIYL